MDLAQQLADARRELAALKSADGFRGRSVDLKMYTKSFDLMIAQNATQTVTATFTPANRTYVDVGYSAKIAGVDDGVSGVSFLEPLQIGVQNHTTGIWVIESDLVNATTLARTITLLLVGSLHTSGSERFQISVTFFSRSAGVVS